MSDMEVTVPIEAAATVSTSMGASCQRVNHWTDPIEAERRVPHCVDTHVR
ncbi:hypothetical protein EDD34_3747 [Myceligenerans xiligouense]|uniref:Uncharacterized protein n=1 Tax=Myceligenerans xiligouense TaxID=253184 RepID=A0A3N4YS79_9MICO|nr:hypothetical protein EDD34_3747 [Myceligenerans xiligouense]